MTDFVLLIIKVHLILSTFLILQIWVNIIRKLRKSIFKDFFDKHMIYVHLIMLLMPYQVVLLSFAQANKSICEVLDKLKEQSK